MVVSLLCNQVLVLDRADLFAGEAAAPYAYRAAAD